MRLAALVILADWGLANIFYFWMGAASVNIVAPMSVAVLALFFTFWRSKSLNGAFIHKIFFSYYVLYFAINLWHLLARYFFPEALAANYYFSLAASNGVFIIIVSTLWLFAILKFLDNYAEEGLMGIFDRNIEKWRRWFGGG